MEDTSDRASSASKSPSVAEESVGFLAESDELLRLLLNSSSEGIYGVDMQGYCSFANPACVQQLGFESVDDLVGKQMHQLAHHRRLGGSTSPEEESEIHKALRDHKGIRVNDELMFRADGTSFPADYWSYPVEQKGDLVGCVVTFLDITERKEKEKLVAEVARFPELNPGPLLRIGIDGIVRVANQAAKDLLGSDLNGFSWRSSCVDIDRAWDNIVNEHGSTGLQRSIDGRDFVFIHRRDFDSDQVFVYGTEITEHLAGERALRKADELVGLLMNSTGEGIYGIDLDGCCTFANPACARLLGFESVDELIGKHMHKLVHHTRANGTHYPVEECRIYQAFRQSGGTHVDDEVMFRADGSSFPCEYWSYPVERDGELVGCVLTFADITERRRVETEVRQTEKMAALGQLSAGLAHELNNPAAAGARAAGQILEEFGQLQRAAIGLAKAGLTPEQWIWLGAWADELCVRSANPPALSALDRSDREDELMNWLIKHDINNEDLIASMLVSAGTQPEDLDQIVSAKVPSDHIVCVVDWLYLTLVVRDLADVVLRSTKGISELVGVVKSYSHMDRASVQLVDLHKGLEDTLTILGHKLKRGIEVVRDFDRSLPCVVSRGSELNQVWTNLIDNAIDATDAENGVITIKTYGEGDDVVIEIGDNGTGIPEDIKHSIFDPFFTTKDVGKGTGLGLDVAHRIVTSRAGGEINFTTRPGETVFRVRIPIEQSKPGER